MAKRSDEIVPVTPEQARLMCDRYTQADVHRDFAQRGGKGTLGTLEDWLRLKRHPAGQNLAILHAVINDRLEDEGKDRVLPDIPYLLPSLVGTEGDGATSEGNSHNLYSNHWPDEQGFRDLVAVGQ